MRALRLWAPLVASCLVATSCSMIRLGYDTLPMWAHWQIERYLSLDDDQSRIVSRRLDEVHRWHRRTQLTQYVRFLREVDDELHDAVDADAIAAWRERVAQAWLPVAEHLAPGVAELAVTLRPEQFERMRKRLKESNETAREKQFPVGARREEARGDRIVKRAEFFLGSLDAEQERDLRAMAARLPASEEEWMAERVARQERIVAMLEQLARERPARAEATRIAREALVGLWETRAPHHRKLDRAIQAGDKLSVQMLARATPEQRAHLTKLVRGYAQDFTDLSGKPVKGGTTQAANVHR